VLAFGRFVTVLTAVDDCRQRIIGAAFVCKAARLHVQ
jgi:hypothetical protein